MRSFKYRIYPSHSQEECLKDILLQNQILYNCALSQRIEYYRKAKLNNSNKRSLSYYDQSRQLVDLRAELPEYKKIYSQTLQHTLKKVDLAYQAFFARVKKGLTPGFPRFKSIDRYNSFTFPQISCHNKKGWIGGIKLTGNKLKVHGVTRTIKVVVHRLLEGTPKTATIKRESSGKWHIIIVCDNVLSNDIIKTNHKTSGIDLGITNFLTFDNGEKIDHPKPTKAFAAKLAKLQGRLSRKKYKSNNRKKAKIKVAKTYEKIRNIRNDFAHKLSNKLVKSHDKIILEKLDIKNMIAKDSKNLSKSIYDVSWSKFTEYLKYKAEEAGTELIFVNPRNTSKTCSGCGNIKDNLELSDRVYNCSLCSLKLDRDINAAKNIKKLGLGNNPVIQ